ncbi:MAG TPA: hypothetical protein VG889_20475 [Rhizomicrobium sp.]|nr:hypothetical protein [Rhizomicrobium sp.]
MRNIKGLALVTVVALTGLGGCQTATPYAPRTEAHSTGYSDKQLAENRYRVSFRGNSATTREEVEDYLLRRSAEVTLGAGYKWFVFDQRDTKKRTKYVTDFAGWPGWRGVGWYWHDWDYGTSTTTAYSSYTAYAEIVLLKDDQASREPRALNANDVLAHLGPLPAAKS